jgi:hypothetical protein
MKVIRIGNGAGFWGDNLDAPRRLAEQGRLDYLTLEYLAELTLSILAHQRQRDPQAGYVGDFPGVLGSMLSALRAQPGLRVVTNAGGMNPRACARAAARELVAGGLEAVLVAAVTGDDLLERIDSLLAMGEPFVNLETGQPLSEVLDRLASANAYLGAEGIVEALSRGARVVITGRVADASLTVGPAVHEFHWRWDDWNALAAATVAGHLIECGAQCTGGMYSGGREQFSLENLGYPIAELNGAGDVCITKPAETGGAVTVATVAEQLVYEIGDPACYMTPDVAADFSGVELAVAGQDRVAVHGAKGRPAPDRYKVSAAYRDGYMAAGTLVVCGAEAADKARRCGQLILERLRIAGVRLRHAHVECLGTGDTLPGVWPRRDDLQEVVLRVSIHAEDREAAQRFTREFAPLVGSGPAGVTGYTGPRPSPYPVFAYWPTTVSRHLVVPIVDVRSAREWLAES